jgi:hypothetical protein
MAKCISRFSNLIALLDSVAMIFGGFSQSCGMFHRYLQLATSTGFLEGCLYSTLRVSQLAQPVNIATFDSFTTGFQVRHIIDMVSIIVSTW